MPVLLKKWFLHDTWTKDEAMLLLTGLDPDGTIIDTYETIYGELLERVELATPLDTFESFPMSYLEEHGGKGLGKMQGYTDQWCLLRSLWESGDHPRRNAPMYYISWAKAKGITVPWIAWAEENGLLKPEVRSSEVKDVTTKERTTLLTIIALLAQEAGIDLDKPSKAASSIVALADAAGIKLGQRTVEEHLKKIPDARERREAIAKPKK